MKSLVVVLRRYASRLAALLVLVVLAVQAQGPSLGKADQEALASRFEFVASPLPDLPGPALRSRRPVNPSLERISGWISSVGAAVALADIDADGLPNDACYVDTRTNRVLVAPVPGSGARYQAFALDFARFRFDETMAPMGCLPGHFKEDQFTDLLVYFWGRTPIVFLHRPGSAGLKAEDFLAQEIVPGDARWFSNSATAADIDGDGHVDLVVGNYFPDGARILDSSAQTFESMQHSMSRALNGGGPHLLRWVSAKSGAAPSVTFEDVSDAIPPEARTGWTLAVAAASLDDTLRPALYVANDFGPDRLLDNRSRPGHPVFALLEGGRSWTTPKSKTLGHDSFKGMGVDFADIEGRGLTDIFVSNITEPYALEESNFAFINTGSPDLRSRGVAPFVDASERLGLARTGWSWDAKLEDFDNSGSLEILQATGFVRGRTNRWPELQELAMSNDQLLHDPASWLRIGDDDDISGADRNPFYVRSASGVYFDVAPLLGKDFLATTGPSRGIATADSFGDGREDFAIAHQWGDTVFYRNLASNRNRFLGLHLRLPIGDRDGITVTDGHPTASEPSRPAIGATAIVTLPSGTKRLAQVDGGNGHSGKRSPDLHFGLGTADPQASVAVALSWRDKAGTIRHASLTLKPGWHTIVLGTVGKGVNG